jgi:hypothetical protein
MLIQSLLPTGRTSSPGAREGFGYFERNFSDFVEKDGSPFTLEDGLGFGGSVKAPFS